LNLTRNNALFCWLFYSIFFNHLGSSAGLFHQDLVVLADMVHVSTCNCVVMKHN